MLIGWDGIMVGSGYSVTWMGWNGIRLRLARVRVQC